MKKSFDYLIVGAGFAGLATAYFLLKKKAGTVCIVEKESAPGLAASGRNASMICQIVRDTTLSKLMLESTQIMKQEWLELFPEITFNRCGSIHIGTSEDIDALGPASHIAQTDFEVLTERQDRSNIAQRFSFLKEANFEEALLCFSDGIIDIKAMIQSLLDYCLSEGALFIHSSEVRPEREKDIYKMKTNSGETIEAKTLINAAGAWAGQVASSACAQEINIRPLKRHIFVSESKPLHESVAHWPIVWNMQNEIYMRPDGEALQLSPCDEELHEPGATTVDLHTEKLLRDRMQYTLPQAADIPFATSWSGLRTFSDDRRFVIGWDGQLENFFWVACLGGYGMTSSAAIGKLAASLLLDEEVEDEFKTKLSPKRFLKEILV